METFRITRPDGSEYDVDANSVEEATKQLNAHLTETSSAQPTEESAKQAYEDAPLTSKARMIVGDPLRRMEDTLTMGIMDKAFDWATGSNKATAQTAEAALRNPKAVNVAADVVGGAMMPTAVPGLVAKVGGGPAARAITGVLGGGAEGAATGAVGALTRGENPAEGALEGGLVGGGAQGLVQGANAAIKGVLGKSDKVPPTSITIMPRGKAATPAARVEVAVNKAQSKAAMRDSPLAEQSEYKRAFERLSTGKYKGKYGPDEITQMRKIAEGDVGTNLPRVVGGILSDKLAAGGLGTAAGIGGGPLAGLATGGAMLGAGRVLKGVSAGGTEEAVQDLRRMMTGTPKNKGPLSAEEQARLARMMREGYLNY